MISIFLIITNISVAGGSTIQSNDLKVEKIIPTADQIIMIVSGSFNLHVQHPNAHKEEKFAGNHLTLTLGIDKGLLKIPRKSWTYIKTIQSESALSWEGYCKDIMQWEGKEILTQMWSTRVIIEDTKVTEIITDSCKFWNKQTPENKS